MADAEAYAGSFVHLTEHHHRVVQYPRVLHLAVELLPFPRSLANAAENAHALVTAHHVVDQLGNQHRLADASPAEQACLAASF